jgi:2,3-dihydroxybiphenyl 1,2-dioxygenase
VGKGFVTGNLGVGHFLQVCKDRDASLDFYTSKLGLQISDYITEKDHPVPGVTAAAVFLHCANPRHHSVALAEMPTDQRVHHIMIEVETLDDVGLAYDRFLNSGTGVVLSIGRHPNDKMTSFYGRTPSGMYVEYGWGGLHIDVGSWKVKKYSKLSDWGHHPPGDALSKPL